MIDFRADCGHTIRVEDRAMGKIVQCPFCGREVEVPSNTDADRDILFQEVDLKELAKNEGGDVSSSHTIRGKQRQPKEGFIELDTDEKAWVKKLFTISYITVGLAVGIIAIQTLVKMTSGHPAGGQRVHSSQPPIKLDELPLVEPKPAADETTLREHEPSVAQTARPVIQDENEKRLEQTDEEHTEEALEESSAEDSPLPQVSGSSSRNPWQRPGFTPQAAEEEQSPTLQDAVNEMQNRLDRDELIQSNIWREYLSEEGEQRSIWESGSTTAKSSFIELIGQAQAAELVDDLGRVLTKDPQWDVREAAIRAMIRSRSEAAVTYISQRLRDLEGGLMDEAYDAEEPALQDALSRLRAPSSSSRNPWGR